jgi:hypothetical protein
MTFTPIPRGTQQWDVPLNAALAQLDSNITSSSGSALQAVNNLSDLTNKIQARTNLGISQGTVAGVNNYNVKDYGAVGNNIADDTAAIQAAIAAAQATGGQVYFPAGNYLLNGTAPLNVTGTYVTFQGSGVGNTSINIGSGFTGSAAITVSGNYFVFQNMTIQGNNSTVTSNPACHGIVGTGAQTLRILNSSFLNINGYAIEAFGTASSTLHGGFVSHVKIQSCAGGIYIKSDSTQTAANFMLDNIFTRFIGVNSGTNANLDCIRIEDSWDVLAQNCIAWMNATTGGTGVAFRVIGNCAATFIQNLDALGPQTGTANVSLEAGTNGSPQNVQITGGVIQQGGVGLNIAGATTQVRVNGVRFINNQTHGAVISTTGPAIYLDSVFFSGNGAAATGTNYDLNWSGTTTGYVTNCRFASAIVATGTAGVQQSINIAAGQNVRFVNVDFQGTGNSSANWFTNTPGIATELSSGKYDFLTTITANNGTRPIELQPSASGNTALAVNVSGSDAFDRARILGNGTFQIGPGTATRDTNLGRAASGILYTDKTLLVGSSTALGDNGVGEIQLAYAATPPSTNTSNGLAIYAFNNSIPLRVRDTSGNIHGLYDAVVIAASDQSVTSATQTASTQIVGSVEQGATYLVELMAIVSSAAASGNTTFSWTGPTGATMKWGDVYTPSDYQSTIGGVISIGNTGASRLVMFQGKLVTTTNAGNLTLTFASSNGSTSVSVLTDSTLTLRRIK